MKKKLIALLLIMIIGVISLLCSCNDDGDNGDGGSADSGNQSQGGTLDGGTDSVQDSNLLYESGSQVNIVCSAAGSAVQRLSAALRELGVSVQVVSDSTVPAEHEIVIGRSNREVSTSAYRRLSRIELDDSDYVGYTVYSDGRSVAIAYHEDIFGLEAAKTVAIDYFIGDIIGTNSSLLLKKGTVAARTFDPIEYQESLDEIEQERKWASFIDKVSDLTDNAEEIAKSIKNYYDTVCTDDVISWFANLYDPAIGGYYYSNSARDNEGFLPDAESTSQALGVWQSSGMANINGGSLIGTIPEWMRLQIIAFLKGLQDPKTGFFYHPQWTKAEVDSHLNRRARDLSKSVSALKSLGSAPTYDTPDGDNGDGIRADGSSVLDDSVSVVSSGLTPRLSGSAVSAVSKVVSVSSAAVAAHLVDDEAFKAYLADCLAANSIPKGQSGHRSF